MPPLKLSKGGRKVARKGLVETWKQTPKFKVRAYNRCQHLWKATWLYEKVQMQDLLPQPCVEGVRSPGVTKAKLSKWFWVPCERR